MKIRSDDSGFVEMSKSPTSNESENSFSMNHFGLELLKQTISQHMYTYMIYTYTLTWIYGQYIPTQTYAKNVKENPVISGSWDENVQ